MKRGRKPVDYTGRIVGELKVIQLVGQHGSVRVWECVCSCGKTCQRMSNYLNLDTNRPKLCQDCAINRQHRKSVPTNFSEKRDKDIQEMRERGETLVSIATKLGITKQRVQQLLKRINATPA